MIIRKAIQSDWDILFPFYKKVYRQGHPLQNKKFWEWQYGNIKNGVSYIVVVNKTIIAHLGANFGGGYAWTLNLYIDKEYRGKGISEKLHSCIKKYAPLAAISASEKGLRMYTRMGWIQHDNLVRYVKINPKFTRATLQEVCKKINVKTNNLQYKDTHYFKQPGLVGLKLKGGTAVSQTNVGGLRVIDIYDVKKLELEAWELGYLWMDYVTSINDSKIVEVKNNNWLIDNKSVIPWLLNPLVANYFSEITFLTEEPIKNTLIVHRSYSDHGRIGSL